MTQNSLKKTGMSLLTKLEIVRLIYFPKAILSI